MGIIREDACRGSLYVGIYEYFWLRNPVFLELYDNESKKISYHLTLSVDSGA